MALLSICDVTFKDRIVAMLHSAFSTLLAYKLISFRGEVAAPPLRLAGLILAQHFFSYCDFYVGIGSALRPSVDIMLVSPFETIDAVITRSNREFLGTENCCRDMLFFLGSGAFQRDHTVAQSGIRSHSMLGLWHPLRQCNQNLS